MEDTEPKISDLQKNEVILDHSSKRMRELSRHHVIDKTSKQILKVVAFAKMLNML